MDKTHVAYEFRKKQWQYFPANFSLQFILSSEQDYEQHATK